MEYIWSIRHSTIGNRLSKSAYGNKRLALHNIFRWHLGTGGSMPEQLRNELKGLYKGFFCIITQSTAQSGASNRSIAKGKVPMSMELYRALCGWFLEQGMAEGLFLYCFLVLTWNLMCRSSSTTKIQWNHIKWTAFDCMQVYFAHQKMDQYGNTAFHPWKICDNPAASLVSCVHTHSLSI